MNEGINLANLLICVKICKTIQKSFLQMLPNKRDNFFLYFSKDKQTYPERQYLLQESFKSYRKTSNKGIFCIIYSNYGVIELFALIQASDNFQYLAFSVTKHHLFSFVVQTSAFERIGRYQLRSTRTAAQAVIFFI